MGIIKDFLQVFLGFVRQQVGLIKAHPVVILVYAPFILVACLILGFWVRRILGVVDVNLVDETFVETVTNVGGGADAGSSAEEACKPEAAKMPDPSGSEEGGGGPSSCRKDG